MTLRETLLDYLHVLLDPQGVSFVVRNNTELHLRHGRVERIDAERQVWHMGAHVRHEQLAMLGCKLVCRQPAAVCVRRRRKVVPGQTPAPPRTRGGEERRQTVGKAQRPRRRLDSTACVPLPDLCPVTRVEEGGVRYTDVIFIAPASAVRSGTVTGNSYTGRAYDRLVKHEQPGKRVRQRRVGRRRVSLTSSDFPTTMAGRSVERFH